MYQEARLLSDNTYDRLFPLVCTAHWMDPLKGRRNGENGKCSSGTVYSETMSFNSVYHKIHFHFISILSQGGII